MTGRLDETLRQLLVDSLPGFFGGVTPPVQATVVQDSFIFDAQSAEAEAGEPRVDDQTDEFPFDPNQPTGPYTLTRPPLPGPRRVRLTSALGDRVPLLDEEVLTDADDPRVFRLQPRSGRELTGFAGVQVLYGVTAVFILLKGSQSLAVHLHSNDAARLEQAEALALAVIELNRKLLVERSTETFTEGDYSAVVTVSAFQFVKATAPAADTRQLQYAAEVSIKATRALRADEGQPIRRIRSPGRSPDSGRPLDLDVQVGA